MSGASVSTLVLRPPTLPRLSKEDRHHGFAALTLFGRWEEWIKRRTERIEFVGDERFGGAAPSTSPCVRSC